MSSESSIAKHYTKGNLLERLLSTLRDDGLELEQASVETLAPYDQFHGRGLEATKELADALSVSDKDHILDIGSGIGGPARYIADRFGCRVSGIDLTEEFCAVANHLTNSLGLENRVTFDQGNALDLPFGANSFDGAYSMNVSMNIADKAGFYAEIIRVLRPGAWLALSEIAQGPGGTLDYPTPWARTADASFLATPQETRDGLSAAGFTDIHLRDTKEETLAFNARAKAMVERGGKPPQRAVKLIHGELAKAAAANTSRGYADSAILPIEVFCRKPDR
ncbi:class I SAM-dependent methyltransferase [Pelagibius sp. Alg239-R121]|uniref:class I SAM-dependent methyltransferase n=1 Tax=Pelagibius sp. Alg239-R121 TaxID=2993448 RepID=UPI0024A65BF4|nr:methyltransferase domain-containing protein [Pelagibius sp. Alg239-R121]